jgi:23S rRNA (uridine2552-2'-O)-methyltransferase
MPRTKSSNEWLRRHVNDPGIKQAQIDGYRRARRTSLIELNEKDRLIKPGMRILILGSAPGGWSQVAGKLVGEKGPSSPPTSCRWFGSQRRFHPG